MLEPDDVAGADLAHGRMVFNRTCVSCHKLFGEGGAIGPDLTGSQRNNLDYVLENLLDPSAVVGHDYKMTLVRTDSGRVITGIVRAETDESLTMQTPTESVIVPKDEIEQRELSPLSMMPEGMLEQFSSEDLRALVAYLASPEQVPLREIDAKPQSTQAGGNTR
jgi:putative heme-binding domain-containing protein